jgi:hypothetical protein
MNIFHNFVQTTRQHLADSLKRQEMSPSLGDARCSQYSEVEVSNRYRFTKTQSPPVLKVTLTSILRISSHFRFLSGSNTSGLHHLSVAQARLQLFCAAEESHHQYISKKPLFLTRSVARFRPSTPSWSFLASLEEFVLLCLLSRGCLLKRSQRSADLNYYRSRIQQIHRNIVQSTSDPYFPIGFNFAAFAACWSFLVSL